jgi:hypothetical protein
LNLRTMMACWIVCFLPWETVNASVWINELVASNRRTLTDASGNTPDWIELYNDGSDTVSLTDDQNALLKWQFPSGTLLPARGYLVVFASGQPTWDLDDLQRLFPGAIDEVYLYGRVLSQDEIAWLAGRTGPYDK